MSNVAMDPRTASPFPVLARTMMGDAQLRKNVRHATGVIQGNRGRRVAEMPDWQELRESGRRLREHTMRHLDFYLEEFERNCTAAGGVVHWATDAEEARRIVVGLVKAAGAEEVIKIKSMTTEEIQLNKALMDAGVRPYETDLAELIIQLGDDQPSHIVVPALHKNRQQIREIFQDGNEFAGSWGYGAGPGRCSAAISAGQVSACEDGGEWGELFDCGGQVGFVWSRARATGGCA